MSKWNCELKPLNCEIIEFEKWYHSIEIATRLCWRAQKLQKVKGKKHCFVRFYCFDWCCFYYFVRNSIVTLLKALCAEIFSFRFANIGFVSEFFFFCVCECKVSHKAFLAPLSTRLLCLVVFIPLVCRLYMCACVCVPLYVRVKMCRWSDKYLANISKTVTTSRAVLA